MIELLVVVAIIGVLASLLLPALNSARKAASKISCASQEGQMMRAYMMYANDWSGYMPGCQVKPGDYPYADTPPHSYLISEYSKVVPRKLLVCPAQPQKDFTSIMRMWRTYGMYDPYAGTLWQTQYYKDRIPTQGDYATKITGSGSYFDQRRMLQPSALALLSDTVKSTDGYAAWKFHPTSTVSSDYYAFLIHGGTANQSFADGHLKSRTRNELLEEGYTKLCMEGLQPYAL